MKEKIMNELKEYFNIYNENYFSFSENNIFSKRYDNEIYLDIEISENNDFIIRDYDNEILFQIYIFDFDLSFEIIYNYIQNLIIFNYNLI